MSGSMRVTRCRMTALWMPKLVLTMSRRWKTRSAQATCALVASSSASRLKIVTCFGLGRSTTFLLTDRMASPRDLWQARGRRPRHEDAAHDDPRGQPRSLARLLHRATRNAAPTEEG